MPGRSSGLLDSISAGCPFRWQIFNKLRVAHEAYRDTLAFHVYRVGVHEFQSASDLRIDGKRHRNEVFVSLRSDLEPAT